jgi:hypothetical protein
MSEALYQQVKRKCNITWEDEDTAARLKNIINSAVPDLIHRLGITEKNFDFSIEGDENTLFLNRCFYEWEHVLSEFYVNYAESIAQVRTKNAVKQYRESEQSE